MSLFAAALQLDPVFDDRGLSGVMKDGYVMSIFSWSSFVKVMDKGRFDAAFYIFPYMLLLEVFRLPLLLIKTRLDFLSCSFNVFRNHLLKIREVGHNSMFKQRFTSKFLGVLFGDEIFLIRILSTIISLVVGLKYRVFDIESKKNY